LSNYFFKILGNILLFLSNIDDRRTQTVHCNSFVRTQLWNVNAKIVLTLLNIEWNTYWVFFIFVEFSFVYLSKLFALLHFLIFFKNLWFSKLSDIRSVNACSFRFILRIFKTKVFKHVCLNHFICLFIILSYVIEKLVRMCRNLIINSRNYFWNIFFRMCFCCILVVCLQRSNKSNLLMKSLFLNSSLDLFNYTINTWCWIPR